MLSDLFLWPPGPQGHSASPSCPCGHIPPLGRPGFHRALPRPAVPRGEAPSLPSPATWNIHQPSICTKAHFPDSVINPSCVCWGLHLVLGKSHGSGQDGGEGCKSWPWWLSLGLFCLGPNVRLGRDSSFLGPGERQQRWFRDASRSPWAPCPRLL